jgi:glucokinase
VLQPGVHRASGNRLGVVSLGTGLGEATVIQNACATGDPLIIPSEGGHKDFGVYDERSAALFQFALTSNAPDNLCLEYFVSGMGLPRLYQFLAGQSMAIIAKPLTSTALVVQGLENPDNSLAGSALFWLIEMLAREAANLALQNSCDAGIVICGGLAKRLRPLLERPNFAKHFQARGAFSAWLADLPVRLCTNTEAPLWGCWELAQRAMLETFNRTHLP